LGGQVDSDSLLKILMHEIRTRNVLLVDTTENLLDSINKKMSYENIVGNANKIKEGTNGISIWLNCIQWLHNPEVFLNDEVKKIDIVDRFRKVRKFYNKEINRKKISVKKIFGAINLHINRSIELIPYLLFDNAVKYSSSGSEITIEFTENIDTVQVEFSSIGPIITDEEKEKIFDYGFRGANAQKFSSSGEGLGLYILKQIVDAFCIEMNLIVKKIPVQYGEDIDVGCITFEILFKKDN